MSQITKILFRQGLNVVRKLQSVIFDIGEPAWCLDTKRLFVGDGSTIGGIPVGVKNWGSVTQLLSTSPVGYVTAAYSIPLSAVEIGDIVYDSSAVTLYYSTSTNPPANAWNAYTFFNLSVSGGNGVSVTTNNGVVSAVLGGGFTVNDSTYKTTLNYDTTTNSGKNLNSGGSMTAAGLITAPGGNSQQWNSDFSTTQTNSGNWQSNYTTVYANSSLWTGPGVTKAWGQFVGDLYNTSTSAITGIISQYNILKITRLNKGIYYISFTIPMPTINYIVVGSGLQTVPLSAGNVSVTEYWGTGSTDTGTASAKSINGFIIQSLDTDQPNQSFYDGIISFNILGY